MVVKIIAKALLNYKWYTNGQRMNMYMLTIYTIHGPYGDIMLNHDLQLNIGSNFTYGIKTIFF